MWSLRWIKDYNNNYRLPWLPSARVVNKKKTKKGKKKKKKMISGREQTKQY